MHQVRLWKDFPWILFSSRHRLSSVPTMPPALVFLDKPQWVCIVLLLCERIPKNVHRLPTIVSSVCATFTLLRNRMLYHRMCHTTFSYWLKLHINFLFTTLPMYSGKRRQQVVQATAAAVSIHPCNDKPPPLTTPYMKNEDFCVNEKRHSQSSLVLSSTSQRTNDVQRIRDKLKRKLPETTTLTRCKQTCEANVDRRMMPGIQDAFISKRMSSEPESRQDEPTWSLPPPSKTTTKEIQVKAKSLVEPRVKINVCGRDVDPKRAERAFRATMKRMASRERGKEWRQTRNAHNVFANRGNKWES